MALDMKQDENPAVQRMCRVMHFVLHRNERWLIQPSQ
jgi:hypothetical protein